MVLFSIKVYDENINVLRLEDGEKDYLLRIVILIII